MARQHEPDRSRLPVDACEHLCTKTMYMAMEDPDLLEESDAAPGAETASFWCALNQMPYGDDGLEVTPETCRPGRPCCIPRMHVPRA